MVNTIQTLLEENVADITSIINTETSANAEYMEDHVISALKDVALGAFPVNQVYVSNRNLGHPFYTNISDAIAWCLNNSGSSIKILEQLSDENMTYSFPLTSNISIEAPNKYNYYLIFNANIENIIGKNITIKYSTGGKLESCKFENCNFIEINGTPGILPFTNSELNNCNLDCTGGDITLGLCSGFNNKYTSSSISIIDGGSLLLNIFNAIGSINFGLNTTNELNIVIEGN